LGDGLDILANLTSYLKEQAERPLNKSLYTAVIHKYPNKESTIGLSEKAINDIMWAYDQQARYLKNQKKFEESHKIYDQALAISTRHYGCLHNYALTLANYANIKSDQILFEKAFHLNEQAFKLQPNNVDNISNYALALSNLARINQDEILFEKAFEQYEKYLTIQPDNTNNLSNYGTTLLELAKLKNDEGLFNKAFEQYQYALKILPNDTYNLGCFYSIKNNLVLSKENFLHAEMYDYLPSNPFTHLSEDKDLDNVRNEPWFTELLERLKAKEQESKVA